MYRLLIFPFLYSSVHGMQERPGQGVARTLTPAEIKNYKRISQLSRCEQECVKQSLTYVRSDDSALPVLYAVGWDALFTKYVEKEMNNAHVTDPLKLSKQLQIKAYHLTEQEYVQLIEQLQALGLVEVGQ